MPPQRRTRAGELAFAGVRAGPFALTRRVASTVRRCCRGLQAEQYNQLCGPEQSHRCCRTHWAARESIQIPRHRQRFSFFPRRSLHFCNPFAAHMCPLFQGTGSASCAAVICPAKRPPFGERETIPLLRLSCISPLWRNTVELDPSNSRIQNLEDRVDLQLDIVAGLMREEGNELEAIRLLNALIGQMITAELELGQLGDTRTGHGRMRLSQDRGVYHPEDLQILGRLFDQTVAALPAALRTSANRLTIAKLILSRAAAD